MKLVLGSGDICLHCFMMKLFKKQSAKFVQNPSRFTKVMAKHIWVCFLCPTVYILKEDCCDDRGASIGWTVGRAR